VRDVTAFDAMAQSVSIFAGQGSAAHSICAHCTFWQLALVLEHCACTENLPTSPLQLAQLEQQTERLLAHQSQALALQKAPRLKPQDVSAVLQQAASDSLGNGAKLSIEASRATLNLNNVSADAWRNSWQQPETKRLHCLPKRTCKKPKQVHKTFGVAH